MQLTPGARLGPYVITALIGAGGMGEVYRAHDSTLGRDVAIKVLSAAWLSDPDRHARFDREARVLASLNHPHVGAIYGFEDLGGVRALILEFVDGPTLAERIAAGPLPMSEALRIAAETADALDAAHERGIVHRDLKPANVKLAPDGQVKVLDFGLAKAAAVGGPNLPSSMLTAAATVEGILLGTVAYMSPEQARGRAVDKRCDIWALGCLLFEMITTRAPFAGETVTDTLAAILEREPDWRSLPRDTPPPLRRLLEWCLTKDVKRRLRDMGDAAVEIRDAMAALARPLETASRLSGTRTVRYQRLTDFVGLNESPAISPDGKMLAFVARVHGRRQVWLRLLAGGAPLQITRDEADHEHPRWLPDSSAVVYYTPSAIPGEPGTVCEVSALGGPPRPLASSTACGDVSHDGRFVAFFRTRNGRIELISASRHNPGEERVVASLRESIPDSLRWSPDDRWLAFQCETAEHFQQQLCVIAAGGGDVKEVVRGALLKGCSWLPDSSGLVYSSSAGSTIPYPPTFNLRARALEGAEDRQITYGPVSYVHPDVHATGTLLACCVGIRSNIWKVPVDGSPAENTRNAERITDQTGQVQTPSVSPDGRELVYLSDSGGHGNLWVMDLAGRGVRQLTFERDPAVTVGVPLWSPSGRHIAFIISRDRLELWLINPDGRGLRRIIDDGFAACWARDGRSLYYSTRAPGGLVTMRAPIDGAPSEVVSGDQISRVAVDDASTLYYPARMRPELGGWDWEFRTAPAGGGPSRALAHVAGGRVPVSPAFAQCVLSPDQQWLAMPLVDGQTTNLWALPAGGGQWRQLTDFGERPTLIARQVSWSPDGLYLYAAIAETNGDVVMLDGLL